MTDEQERRVAARFAKKHPILTLLDFDGVRLFPDWAYLVMGGLILLFICRR